MMEPSELAKALAEAILGSDRKREMFNFLRYREGVPSSSVILMFEYPKGLVKKIREEG